MKDIIITVKRQRRELWCLLVSFIIANIVNIGAIIYYEAPATEIITSIFYVIALTIGIYIVWALLRLLYSFVKSAVRKKKA